MPGLLTAISVGLSAVVLVQAQTIAPGPAAPGGPNPYGVGPGGTPLAPGAGSTTPSSTAPEGTNVRQQDVKPEQEVKREDKEEARQERRRGRASRSSISDGEIGYRRRRVSARHRGCWRCRYSWSYSGAYYLWPAPYFAGASERRFYNNYVRMGWPPPYAGGYFAVIVPTRVNRW